jgi:hypothetical protein
MAVRPSLEPLGIAAGRRTLQRMKGMCVIIDGFAAAD